MSDHKNITDILTIVRGIDKKLGDVEELPEMQALGDFLTSMALLPLDAKMTPEGLDQRVGLALHLLGMNPDDPHNLVMRGRLLIHMQNERLRLVRAFHALGESRVKMGRDRYQCECMTCDSVRAADEIVKETPAVLEEPLSSNDHIVTRLYRDGAEHFEEVRERVEATEAGLSAFGRRAYRGVDATLDKMEITADLVHRMGGRALVIAGNGAESLEDALRTMMGMEVEIEDADEPESPST